MKNIIILKTSLLLANNVVIRIMNVFDGIVMLNGTMRIYDKGRNMENRDIKVSIITVSYNSERTIAQTIRSVLEQTYKNIVVTAYRTQLIGHTGGGPAKVIQQLEESLQEEKEIGKIKKENDSITFFSTIMKL